MTVETTGGQSVACHLHYDHEEQETNTKLEGTPTVGQEGDD